MKEPFGTKMKVWAIGALAVVAGGTFTSCQEEIAEENRFTFKGELIADHLENNEMYSSFCTILKQAKIGRKASSMYTTLSTYGSYTCFAPTNEAIDQYLLEKYNEYEESKQDPSGKIKNTGITSPRLEDLSDSMATVIAKNHILELGVTTLEVNNGAFPKKTMNRRSVMLNWKEDSLGRRIDTVDGIEILEEEKNVETENGYINCIKGVLAPSDQPTSTLLASQKGFEIFSAALEKTGFDEYLAQYDNPNNPEYDGLGQYGPAFETQNDQEPPLPETNKMGFTLLVEPDELLADPSKNSFGMSIQSLDDLVEFAEKWYKYDEDIPAEELEELKTDYTNPENALYKFVAYHIIDRTLLYKSGRSTGGFIMENYRSEGDEGIDKGKFDSEENYGLTEGLYYDRYDYFETALPYTCIKVTKPFSNMTGEYKKHDGGTEYLKNSIVINYSQDMGTFFVNPAMEYHMNVIVEDASTTRTRPGLEDFQDQSINGMIYTINKILVYNEDEMRGNILNERMRWDVFSLFPELTSNDVRWIPEDTYTLVYIPENYCKRLKHNNADTKIYYLRPHNNLLGTTNGGYANYQGDEMLVTGKYDFQYRIPYVPQGSYEIRFGFSTSDARGVAQFYFGEEGKINICGIPLDMRSQNQNFMGWFEENEESEDDNRKSDKAMRNRGFMKAPASMFGDGGGIGIKNMRYAKSAFRRIIGTYELEYGKNYWLRFKDVTDGTNIGADGKPKPNEFNQDYLEIVPASIINNPGKPEDIY